MEGHTDRQIDGQVDIFKRRTYGQNNRKTHAWTEGETNGQMDKRMGRQTSYGSMDEQTNGWTEIRTHR